MITIYLLILLSLFIAAGFLAGFVWSVCTGQYEDTCTPSLRLLTDEPKSRPVKTLESVPQQTDIENEY